MGGTLSDQKLTKPVLFPYLEINLIHPFSHPMKMKLFLDKHRTIHDDTLDFGLGDKYSHHMTLYNTTDLKVDLEVS